MVKHVKLFEQFVREGATMDKFIDIEAKLSEDDGLIKPSLRDKYTIKDKKGQNVVENLSSSEKIPERKIYINPASIEFYLTEEGSYKVGEILTGSLDLTLLAGLSLDLTKASMGPDFKELKIEDKILSFEYTIPSDIVKKNEKEWGSGKPKTFGDKFLSTIKGGVEKVVSTLEGKAGKDLPPFSIVIPSPSIEDYGYLSINIIFPQDLQIS